MQRLVDGCVKVTVDELNPAKCSLHQLGQLTLEPHVLALRDERGHSQLQGRFYIAELGNGHVTWC